MGNIYFKYHEDGCENGFMIKRGAHLITENSFSNDKGRWDLWVCTTCGFQEYREVRDED